MTVQALKGRFSALEKIKKGGQKVVYKATTPNGMTYVLKIVGNANDARVLQEIQLVTSMNLQYVPHIFESGIAFDEIIEEDVLYIIEEHIDGLSLRDWVNNGNRFSLLAAFRALSALLEIEAELEKRGILHRDINPNNIILDRNGHIFLIDFGLAKNMYGSSLTQTAAQHGPFTPGYAPHEQFANMKMEQDVRTDLFQIGVTVYECCCGKNPFVEPNETMFQILSRTATFLPPALILEGDVKGLFSQFIQMLMAKNQSQRPDSAADALRYLAAIKSSLVMEE